MFPPLIPVQEASEKDEVPCAQCGVLLEEGCYIANEYYCEGCATVLVDEAEVEAREYALQECRITRPLPPYYLELEHRCTPEEYEYGDRESYTLNSHACYCRHRCTNYEELISGLDRDCPLDQILYLAIRERIDELVEEAQEFAFLEGDEGDDSGADGEPEGGATEDA